MYQNGTWFKHHGKLNFGILSWRGHNVSKNAHMYFVWLKGKYYICVCNIKFWHGLSWYRCNTFGKSWNIPAGLSGFSFFCSTKHLDWTFSARELRVAKYWTSMKCRMCAQCSKNWALHLTQLMTFKVIEQWTKTCCLGYMFWIILPNYVGTIKNRCKDPY